MSRGRNTEISAGRYTLELALDQAPERMLADLMATGASLVSLNPIRDTLEDFFVKHVAEAGGRSSDRTDSGQPPAASGQRSADSGNHAGH